MSTTSSSKPKKPAKPRAAGTPRKSKTSWEKSLAATVAARDAAAGAGEVAPQKPAKARKPTAFKVKQKKPKDPLAATAVKLDVWPSQEYRDANLPPQTLFVEAAFVEEALELLATGTRFDGVVVETMPIHALGAKKAFLAALKPLEHHLREGTWIPPHAAAETRARADSQAKPATPKEAILTGVTVIAEGLSDAGQELAIAGIGKLRQGVSQISRYLEQRR